MTPNALTFQTDAGQDAEGEDSRGVESPGRPHELCHPVDEQRPQPRLSQGSDANLQLVRTSKARCCGGGGRDQHPQGQVPHRPNYEPGEPEGAGVLKHPLKRGRLPALGKSPAGTPTTPRSTRSSPGSPGPPTRSPSLN